jgi:hypothetical protein
LSEAVAASERGPAPAVMPRRRSWTFLHWVWRAANSALFISVMGSLLLAGLTDIYSTRQADSADLAVRRADLSKLVVELNLRLARLHLAAAQLQAKPPPPADALERDGARTIAIVDGDQATVTSDPAFREEHLVSVLSRAELDAGVALTDKAYLLTFTDLVNCAALEQTPYVVARIQPLAYFLQTRLATGEIPISASRLGSKTYTAQVYAALAAQSAQAAQARDSLSPTAVSRTGAAACP